MHPITIIILAIVFQQKIFTHSIRSVYLLYIQHRLQFCHETVFTLTSRYTKKNSCIFCNPLIKMWIQPLLQQETIFLVGKICLGICTSFILQQREEDNTRRRTECHTQIQVLPLVNELAFTFANRKHLPVFCVHPGFLRYAIIIASSRSVRCLFCRCIRNLSSFDAALCVKSKKALSIVNDQLEYLFLYSTVYIIPASW